MDEHVAFGPDPVSVRTGVNIGIGLGIGARLSSPKISSNFQGYITGVYLSAA